jgi:transcription antitermination factor NusG
MMERNRYTTQQKVASHEATTPFRVISQAPSSALEWYALRLYFSGPKKMLRVKEIMDSHDIENFMPTKHVIQENENGSPKRVLVPAISDLIIIKAPADILYTLKAEHPGELQNLVYRRNLYRDGSWSSPIIVPDRDMREFMGAVSGHEDSLEYLDIKSLEGKTGRPVRIIAGQFKGVEGILKRVDKNRAMILPLANGVNMKITITHASDIEFL